MTNFNPGDYLSAAVKIARTGGKRILEFYTPGIRIEQKTDRSPLTEADRAANEIIERRLKAITPDIPALSEESAVIKHELRSGWKRFWLVDPLDGTKEFITHNDEFTVNIALIDGDKPVLGVVHAPVADLTYFACAGQPAFKQRGEEGARTIRARRYEGGKPIITTSRSHADNGTAAFLKNIGEHDVVALGSSLKFCLVAEGTVDLYPRLGPTMEWDTAAAQCIVEAAGGRVTDLDRRPLTYNKPSLLNPSFLVSGAGDYDWYRYLPAV
jgi:3'(2'), 5'-bisphosphate nucleotidase